MGSIEQELAATRMFGNLTPEQIKDVADLGQEIEFGDGFVALEIQAPSGMITIETLHQGDPVGWSWLVEPYLTHFDARSRGVTRAIKFDAAALRHRCAEDAQLGYELMRSFTSVIVERLHATRLQLLDVYGSVSVG